MDLSKAMNLSTLGISEAIECEVIEYNLEYKYYDWFVIIKENPLNGYVAKYFFKVYTDKYYEIGVEEVNAIKRNTFHHYNSLLSAYIKFVQSPKLKRVEILMRYDGEPLSYWIQNNKINKDNYAKIGIKIMREVCLTLYTLNVAHLNINPDTIMLKISNQPNVESEVHLHYFTSLVCDDSTKLSAFILDTEYLAPEIASFLPEFRPTVANRYKGEDEHSPLIEMPLSKIVNDMLPNIEIKDSTKLDIFALALVIYNMGCIHSGKHLISIDKTSDFEMNQNCLLNQNGTLYTKILKDQILLMLKDEPMQRPSYKQILSNLPHIRFPTICNEPPKEISNGIKSITCVKIIRTWQSFHTIYLNDGSNRLLVEGESSASLPTSVVLPNIMENDKKYYMPEKYINLYEKYKQKTSLEFADIKEILNIMKIVASNLDMTKSFHGGLSLYRIFTGEVIRYIYGSESNNLAFVKIDGSSRIKEELSSCVLKEEQKYENEKKEEKNEKTEFQGNQIEVIIDRLNLAYAPPEIHAMFLAGISKSSIDGPKVDAYMLALVMLSIIALKLTPDEMLEYFYGAFLPSFPISSDSTNQWIKSREIINQPNAILDKIKTIQFCSNDILRPKIENFFTLALNSDPALRISIDKFDEQIRDIFNTNDSIKTEYSPTKDSKVANAKPKTDHNPGLYTDDIEYNELAHSCSHHCNSSNSTLFIPEFKSLDTRALENKAITLPTIIKQYSKEINRGIPFMKYKSKYIYDNIPCLAQVINVNQENYITFYVIGGCIAMKAVDNMYKPSVNDPSTLIQMQNMLEKRMLFGATAISEYIYVAGGRYDYYNQFTNSNTIEYYDFKDNHWRMFQGSMKQRLINPALVASSDFKLYVVFGITGMIECKEENSVVDGNSTLIEIFDCITKKLDRVINISNSVLLAVSYMDALLAEIDDANLILFGGKPIYKVEKGRFYNLPAQMIHIDKIEDSVMITEAYNRKHGQYVDYSFRCFAAINSASEIIFMPLVNQSSRVAVYDKEKSIMSYWKIIHENSVDKILQEKQDSA